MFGSLMWGRKSIIFLIHILVGGYLHIKYVFYTSELLMCTKQYVHE